MTNSFLLLAEKYSNHTHKIRHLVHIGYLDIRFRTQRAIYYRHYSSAITHPVSQPLEKNASSPQSSCARFSGSRDASHAASCRSEESYGKLANEMIGGSPIFFHEQIFWNATQGATLVGPRSVTKNLP